MKSFYFSFREIKFVYSKMLNKEIIRSKDYIFPFFLFIIIIDSSTVKVSCVFSYFFLLFTFFVLWGFWRLSQSIYQNIEKKIYIENRCLSDRKFIRKKKKKRKTRKITLFIINEPEHNKLKDRIAKSNAKICILLKY